MRWLLLSLALAVCNVQSQEPTKSQPEAHHTAKKRSTNQRGTENQPFIVKAKEAEKTPERIEQDRQENEEKTRRESRLVLWTLILAVLTGVLAVIAGIQVAMFYKQLGLMKTAVTDGTETAKAARDTAKTTYAAFVASHRPRMVLRSVYFDFPPDGGEIAKVPIKFIFVNIGDTEATLLGFDVDWAETESRNILPPPILYEDMPRHFDGGGEFKSGFQLVHLWESPLSTVSIEAMSRPKANAFYVFGKITYLDNNGSQRTSAFCRWYDPKIRSFRKLDGSKYMEYEYED